MLSGHFTTPITDSSAFLCYKFQNPGFSEWLEYTSEYKKEHYFPFISSSLITLLSDIIMKAFSYYLHGKVWRQKKLLSWKTPRYQFYNQLLIHHLDPKPKIVTELPTVEKARGFYFNQLSQEDAFHFVGQICLKWDVFFILFFIIIFLIIFT